MTRKHNTKHHRTLSNYRKRLEARGLRKNPRRITLNELRKKVGLPPYGGGLGS